MTSAPSPTSLDNHKYSPVSLVEIPNLSREDLTSIFKVSTAFNGKTEMLKSAFKDAYDNNDFFQAIVFAHAFKSIQEGGKPVKLAEADIDFALFREMLKCIYPDLEITEHEIEQNYSRAFEEGLPAAAMVCFLREYRLFGTDLDIVAKIVKEGLIKDGLLRLAEMDDQPEGMFYYGRICLFDGSQINEKNLHNGFYYMKKSGFCQLVEVANLEDIKANLSQEKDSFREVFGMIIKRDGTVYCTKKEVFDSQANQPFPAPNVKDDKKRRSCILV